MSVSVSLATELRQTAHVLADRARQVTLSYFRTSSLSLRSKDTQSFDPVTQADQEAEQHMRELLAKLRPQDAIYGEEYGQTPGRSGLTWVLDPIDGTRAFLSGATTWGVLIALADDSGPIYGMIDQPYIQERFEGGFGVAQMSAALGERVLRCRSTQRVDEAVLYSTFPEIGTPDEYRAFRRVADRVRLTRYGSDCYAYALLAAGQIDLVIEAGLQPYDIQAPMAVVRAAGGIVTNWQGGPCHMGGQAIAAANPQIHRAALALLQGDNDLPTTG